MKGGGVIICNRRNKISAECLKFIKNSNLSYKNIQDEIKRKFGIKTSKSLLSYYKGNKNRLIKINFNKLTDEETDWLNGIFLADGCKYKDRKYSYVIKFALDLYKDLKIVNKLCYIFKKLGCKYAFSIQKNSLIIKTYSKELFKKLPIKNIFFKPQNQKAFLGGLIDGDGCKKGNAAILVQYNNVKTMEYLSKNLNLKQRVFPVLTNFGPSIRREYYIPKCTCDLIKKRGLSIKLKSDI